MKTTVGARSFLKQAVKRLTLSHLCGNCYFCEQALHGSNKI